MSTSMAHDMANPIAQLLTPANLTTALIAINLLALAACGIDKAVAGRWRVQESTLLALALLGGTPGAYAGRALFRHKTRKQPFSSRLHTIAILQLLGLVAGCVWLWREPGLPVG